MIQLAAKNAHLDKQKAPKIASLGHAASPFFRMMPSLDFGTRRAFISRVAYISTRKEVLSMLVLSRKVGEKVVIDGCIIVTVVAVDGNKIRLGITAPPDVRIDREEVHRRRMEFADVALDSVEADSPEFVTV
jgi:carbon storage regulator